LRKIPLEFVIVGAAKSGSTFLFDLLCGHPALLGSSPKEPGFFAYDDLYREDLIGYESFFDSHFEGKKCFEASTAYSRCNLFPHVMPRLALAYPDLKLIYIVRDPVDRFRSHYDMLCRFSIYLKKDLKLREKEYLENFEKAKSLNDFFGRPPFLFEAGQYELQLKHMEKFFPPDQIKILLFEELVKEPEKVWNDVIDFLKLEKIPMPQRDLKKNSSENMNEYLILKGLRMYLNKYKWLHSILEWSMVSPMKSLFKYLFLKTKSAQYERQKLKNFYKISDSEYATLQKMYSTTYSWARNRWNRHLGWRE
jgi:hypothetical protein